MPKSTFTWVVPPGLAFPQLMDRYSKAIFQTTNEIAHKNAAEMEAWAKANAPWQDRTGAARATLKATVAQTGQATEITLAHGVDYGVWLELTHGGKNAIIAPAIDYWGPKLMQDLRQKVAGGAVPGFTFSASASRFRQLSTGRFASRAQILGLLGR